MEVKRLVGVAPRFGFEDRVTHITVVSETGVESRGVTLRGDSEGRDTYINSFVK